MNFGTRFTTALFAAAVIAGGAGAVLTAPVTASAAPAAAAHPAARVIKRDFTNATLCTTANTWCQTADGTSGDAVYGKTYSGGTNQQTQLQGAFVCNSGASDHVSSSGSCPFAAGSGLNSQWDGHEIIELARSNGPNYCYTAGITDTTKVYQKDCGSTGYLWVLAGTGTSGGSHSGLISVYASNNRVGSCGDSGVSMGSDVLDNPVFLDCYLGSSGTSQWTQH